MAEDGRLSCTYRVMFEALEKCDHLVTMVRDIASALQVSVVVTDPCGRLLADSGQSVETAGEPDDGRKHRWLRMLERYYADEAFYGTREESAVTDRSSEGVIRVLSAITTDSGQEGFCITEHDGEDGADAARELNRLISRGLAVALRRSGYREYICTGKEPGVRQVLSRILLGSREKTERLPELDEDVYKAYAAPPYLMAVFCMDGHTPMDEWQLRVRLDQFFPGALTYFYTGRAAVLFVNMDSQEQRERARDCVRELTREENCRCALGEVFCDRAQIGMKKKLLERLLRIGEEIDKESLLYTEYDYYMELICSYAYGEIGAEGYGTEELRLLEAEDQEKGTELCKSLKGYLMAGNNVNLAAKKLFIHRNTMVYRLGKIHEIIKLDINDPETARRLLLSIILREFAPGGSVTGGKSEK